MLDLPLVAFDIETIPDPDAGRAALGLTGDDASVIAEMMRLRAEATEGKSQYPAQPWHRVVCVCATILDPASGRVRVLNLGTDDPLAERVHIRRFFELVEGRSPFLAPNCRPRLLSWNGSGFDLPVLRYRAMRHGVVAKDFHRQDGERRFNNYLNRFHDLHVDLMDLLCGYGAAPRASLDAVATSLDLPNKSFLERPLHEHVQRGEHRRVVEYCKLDTVLTLLIGLHWGRHAGWLPERAMQNALEGLLDALRAQPFEGWQKVVQGLERQTPLMALELAS